MASKVVRKQIKGTNIVVEHVAPSSNGSLLCQIGNDDQTELEWYHQTLRPVKNLTHPSEAFLQSIKALRPAAVFNTFDQKKAKLRRLVKQKKDQKKALERRKKEVAPTAAFKASVNPHKIPRVGTSSGEETRFLTRSQKSHKNTGEKKEKMFYKNWKQSKTKNIGKKI